MLLRMLAVLVCFALPGITSAKELKVAMGSKLSPMHFVDGTGTLAGFEVDLVRLFAAEQGVQVTFLDPGKLNSSTLDLVVSGKADMAVNSMAITGERRQLVDFSDPYLDSGAALLSRAEAAAVPFDLHRRSYVTVGNSLYAKLLKEKNLPIWKEVTNIDEALALLKNEKLPRHRPVTFVHDWTALQKIADENKDLNLADSLIMREEYGAAFKRGASTAAWNDFLGRARRDGRYAQLLQKWFKGKQAPSTATIPAYEYRGGRDDRPEHLEFELLPGGKVADYLPVLNAEPGAKISDAYYAYLLKHYGKKWLPHLEELFLKDYPNVQDKFYGFVRNKDITGLLPVLYQAIGHPRASARDIDQIDRLLVHMAREHPELRPGMIKAYADHHQQNAMQIKYAPGVADGNASRMDITVLPDRTGAAARTITASLGQEAELTVLPTKQGEATRITINGITGTLKEMILSGDRTVSVVSLEKGSIATVGLPDNVGYSDMSSDGNIMYLQMGKLRLSFDVKTEKVFRMDFVNPLADRTSPLNDCGKPEGVGPFVPVTSATEDVYYIGLEQGAPGGLRSTVYRQEKQTCRTTKLVQFLGSAVKPVIMDDKLFSSDVGYDMCAPLTVVDLRSGLKVDAGPCGGIVPVGPHELLYCAEGGWIINTETLQRRKIDLDLQYCPGSTGELRPHPLPGHFIFIDWTMC